LGLMQSSYAIGEAIAALVVLVVLPRLGWRAVFFVGVLPALLVMWIRTSVPEPAIWKARSASPDRKSKTWPLPKAVLRAGSLAAAMNAFSLFGYWGLFTWIPAYLSLPVSQGGRGVGLVRTTSFFLVLCAGKWLGYVAFGFFADAFGRRKPYFAYLLIAAALVPLYGMTRGEFWLLALGPMVGFFGTGSFSGYAAITSEIFPSEIRAAAMGLSYNVGRVFSAIAPFAVGVLAIKYGIGPAFLLQAAAFLLAAMISLALPETVGQSLT